MRGGLLSALSVWQCISGIGKLLNPDISKAYVAATEVKTGVIRHLKPFWFPGFCNRINFIAPAGPLFYGQVLIADSI
jgi:hypothetical protein